jgi:geranylgeranyl diphosphate synthase type II
MYSPAQLLTLYEEKFNSNNFNERPTTLYEPVNHIMQIKGKRIRPVLLLMSCDLFGGDIQQALNPAFSMEVFHNFTLVHDDIMDHADIRRGVPTVHKLYGLNAGILAGDVMLAYSYKYLTKIPVHTIPDVLAIFNKTSIEIFEGQQMDIDFEGRKEVSEAEYIRMIECKTSVLLACCLQIGAIISSADAESQKLVYDFGLNLGLAFQIKDDYLDAFGEGAKVGKRIGGDILQNKKTFLLITALNTASEKEKKELNQLMHEANEEKKISGIKKVFEDLGVKEATEKSINLYYDKAIASLMQVNSAKQSKDMLLSFAQMIHDRDY